jgi:hypothetical protein
MVRFVKRKAIMRLKKGESRAPQEVRAAALTLWSSRLKGGGGTNAKFAGKLSVTILVSVKIFLLEQLAFGYLKALQLFS